MSIYAACTLHAYVTTFSTGYKFHLVSLSYSYSSRPYQSHALFVIIRDRVKITFFYCYFPQMLLLVVCTKNHSIQSGYVLVTMNQALHPHLDTVMVVVAIVL